MSTLADMLAEMASDMERSDDAAFRSKIAAAIRHYQPTRFFFNESRSTVFNAAIGADFYDWAAIGNEFYAIDGVFVTDTGGNVLEVRRCDYRELELIIDSTSSQNTPTIFASIGGGLRVYPVPNDVYPVRVTGHIKAPAPASDDETGNPWMAEAYDLIMSRAKAELYAHRYEDSASALVMREAESDAFSRLKKASGTKTGTGFFVPTQF
jgi:hypothetical protein